MIAIFFPAAQLQRCLLAFAIDKHISLVHQHLHARSAYAFQLRGQKLVEALSHCFHRYLYGLSISHQNLALNLKIKSCVMPQFLTSCEISTAPFHWTYELRSRSISPPANTIAIAATCGPSIAPFNRVPSSERSLARIPHEDRQVLFPAA